MKVFDTALFFLAISTTAFAQDSDPIHDIRAVLTAQEKAWNEGDYESFMEGYWKSDSLTFASGGTYNRGWQTTLDNYKKRYPDRATMGVLSFTLFDIRLLSEDDAFVFGQFELERETDHPIGVFTLMLEKMEEGWKITFDHTSAQRASIAASETGKGD